jgi:DNA-binding response OmpR family regulator
VSVHLFVPTRVPWVDLAGFRVGLVLWGCWSTASWSITTGCSGTTPETPLVIDLPARRVTKAGAVVRLTPTEWGLLEMLVRTPGRLVTQRDLLHEVWGPSYGRETNYLRVYVGGLRKKLEDDPGRPRHLITEPGMGYRFEP